jgi:hypothetical protein
LLIILSFSIETLTLQTAARPQEGRGSSIIVDPLALRFPDDRSGRRACPIAPQPDRHGGVDATRSGAKVLDPHVSKGELHEQADPFASCGVATQQPCDAIFHGLHRHQLRMGMKLFELVERGNERMRPVDQVERPRVGV